jgi:hypothetical protein
MLLLLLVEAVEAELNRKTGTNDAGVKKEGGLEETNGPSDRTK